MSSLASCQLSTPNTMLVRCSALARSQSRSVLSRSYRQRRQHANMQYRDTMSFWTFGTTVFVKDAAARGGLEDSHYKRRHCSVCGDLGLLAEDHSEPRTTVDQHSLKNMFLVSSRDECCRSPAGGRSCCSGNLHLHESIQSQQSWTSKCPTCASSSAC